MVPVRPAGPQPGIDRPVSRQATRLSVRHRRPVAPSAGVRADSISIVAGRPLARDGRHQQAQMHWFQALRDITDANPVSSTERVNIAAMQEAWLNWGKRNGLAQPTDRITGAFPNLAREGLGRAIRHTVDESSPQRHCIAGASGNTSKVAPPTRGCPVPQRQRRVRVPHPVSLEREPATCRRRCTRHRRSTRQQPALWNG